MMHCLGFSIYSNGCEKRTVCPLSFHSYLLFKHSFYIIPQFMVFLQVKFGFSILFKIFLTPRTRLFPGFFRSFSIFRKKNKKSACFSCKVRYTKRVGWQGQLVKGLRRRPLTAKTRVRFSYWLLYFPTNWIHMLSEPLTWPVGQGVKTSPSHGENTSSILVLAALFSDKLNTYVKRTAYMASWSRG